MKQTTTRETEMQKPESMTQAQWDELMAHLQSQPKIKVVESGTLETRSLVSAEQMEKRGGGEIVQGWWTR